MVASEPICIIREPSPSKHITFSFFYWLLQQLPMQHDPCLQLNRNLYHFIFFWSLIWCNSLEVYPVVEIIFDFLSNLLSKISIISPRKMDLFFDIKVLDFLLKKVFFFTTIATGLENFFEKEINFDISSNFFCFHLKLNI